MSYDVRSWNRKGKSWWWMQGNSLAPTTSSIYTLHSTKWNVSNGGWESSAANGAGLTAQKTHHMKYALEVKL